MKFQELMRLAGVSYRESGHEHCRQGWIQIDCPFCSKKGHFRLGYNIRGKYLNCWACGPHRLLETLVMLTGWSIKEALHLVKDLETTKFERIPTYGKLELPKRLGPLLKPHRDYLKGRGFDPDHIERLWKIKGIDGLGGRLAWRIFIPVTYQGEIVSWTTRSISDQHEKRYWAAREDQEKIPKNRILYGQDYVHGHTVIVCEGPLDVWKIGPGSVCTFGTGYTSSQVNRIGRYLNRVILYDNEPEGQKKAKDLCDRLCMLEGYTFNVTLSTKDAGNAPVGEIRDLRKHFLLQSDE
jgi:hypothetical protein